MSIIFQILAENNQSLLRLAALGVDSRLSFEAAEPVRYTLLLGKSFPALRSFTIALWLRVTYPDRHGSVLSYKHDNSYNIIRIRSGPSVGLTIHGKQYATNIRLNASTWTHVTYTWTSRG